MNDFRYLAEKIAEAPFRQEPFRHVYIDDFLSKEHFAAVLGTPEIAAPAAGSDRELLNVLRERGYKPIPFPGSITDEDKYLRWRKNRTGKSTHTATEGFGVVLRLTEMRSAILSELNDYLRSDAFNRAVAEKFGVELGACTTDGGIQKYLDGYEISPHPDIRRKAATFMVNINPNERSESSNHHTHYMTFRPERRYVQSFWEGNPDTDRCWVPWSWCDTQFQQTKNNSIVLFAPSDDTLHAVKADYDHLTTQRTQLYGNLWFAENPAANKLEWEDYELSKMAEANSGSAVKRLAKSILPASMIRRLKGGRDGQDSASRTY